jgi:hypothetical protein
MPLARQGLEKISVARLPVTGSNRFAREEDIAFLVPYLRGHWKFGQEISDERCVNERLTNGHVALGLAASRNEDELPVSDALLSTIDDPEFWRV